MTNKQHIDKLIIESEELIRKTTKLKNFMESDRYKTLDKYHQDLLTLQYNAMNSYLYILMMRIEDLDA